MLHSLGDLIVQNKNDLNVYLQNACITAILIFYKKQKKILGVSKSVWSGCGLPIPGRHLKVSIQTSAGICSSDIGFNNLSKDFIFRSIPKNQNL